MSRNVPGTERPGPDGGQTTDRLRGLIARQPLVLVVGVPGEGRRAALAELAGPAAGGTMIDLGALWMAVDPPGDRPRTVRLNGAPSAVGHRGWEAIASAIGAVAAPPAVVLIDTFQGLIAALGVAGAIETVTALVVPGRTVVLVLDNLAEAERIQALAAAQGIVVAVDGSTVLRVCPLDELLEIPPEPPPTAAPVPTLLDRRWRWWRRPEPAPRPVAQAPATEQPRRVPTEGPPPDRAAVLAGTGVSVRATIRDAGGARVTGPLAPGGYYLVRYHIRLALAGSYPEEASPAGAWVDVAVLATTITLPGGPHPMFMPRDGAAWTCPCSPGGPHTCRPEERSENLEVPFMAPRRPGMHRLEVVLRYQGIAVHKIGLDLPVAVAGGPTSTVTLGDPQGT